MPNRKLKDIVARQELVHASISDSVADTVKRMQRNHVGAAVILGADGELKGIFTGSNLFNDVLEPKLDPLETCIAEVMTENPICLHCEQTGIEAVRHMREHGIRHIVVVKDGDEGYGVVSIRDFPNEELGDYEKEFEFERKLWESI
ncbi:CBS domain-containing protein [Thalassospiraceae bacterium LMO-JJ14]|nr:CBS domain-containing protein [Thalassospiraceae bacterium LMO-JJ14]